MSGGSYGYLGRAETLDDIWTSHRGSLDQMIAFLEARAPESAALVASRAVAAQLAVMDQPVGPIVKVWKAVEWATSGDWADFEIDDAIAEFGPTRSWYFTFGHGQYHPDGRHLLGWYVKIPAESAAAAKEEMVRLFGQRWSSQYDSADDAGVAQFGLTELSLPSEPVAIRR